MAEEVVQAVQETPKSAIFAVKTTANQERSVANMIAMVTRKEQLDIRSVLVPEELKGYVLVESPMQEIVEQAITNIPHAKAVVRELRPSQRSSISWRPSPRSLASRKATSSS